MPQPRTNWVRELRRFLGRFRLGPRIGAWKQLHQFLREGRKSLFGHGAARVYDNVPSGGDLLPVHPYDFAQASPHAVAPYSAA